ncbi:MAG: M14 family metallopeptidase [Chloroflexota bacterium]
MLNIPASYDDSRARFRSYAERIRDLWPAARFDAHPLAFDPSVSIDWCSAEAIERKERLFILTTGLHGIEGYLGAAMLDIFVNDYLPGFDPATSGILLVHAVNPWGMKHWRRNNPHNVDLNRNFCDPSSLTELNPDYEPLFDFLNPSGPLKSIVYSTVRFAGQAISSIRKFGVSRIREAALMGQYCHPEGIYFGGADRQEETEVMQSLFQHAITDYTQVTHLDMHTGYGPRLQITLVNSPQEPMTSVETADRFGVPRVAATTPDEFYTIHGDMTDYLYTLAREKSPKTKLYAGAFEFGTFGESLAAGIRSLRITILKNQANLFGANPAAQAWVDEEYRELYLPADPAWRARAENDGRQAFEGILQAEGFVK